MNTLSKHGIGIGLLAWVVALGATGCVNSKATQPRGAPPTPETVTRDEPGGDAFDPQRAALERLLTGGWGWRNDKRDVFHFPLADWEHWRRVKFWGVPTFVGFRYGDKHWAVAGLWAHRLLPDDPEDPQVCLDRLEAWGAPIGELYGATMVKGEVTKASWKSKDDVVVQAAEAKVSSVFAHRKYVGVVGASFGWPRVCVVYGYAFRADDVEDLAQRVRDRFAREAFSRLTVDDPLRSPDGIDWLPSPE